MLVWQKRADAKTHPGPMKLNDYLKSSNICCKDSSVSPMTLQGESRQTVEIGGQTDCGDLDLQAIDLIEQEAQINQACCSGVLYGVISAVEK